METTTVLDDVARSRVRAFVTVAMLAAAGVVVLYALAVRTGWGQRLDDIAFAGRSAASPATTHRTDRLLGSVTHTSLALLGLALCAVALARRRVRLAVGVAIALAGSVITSEVLKRAVFDRPLLHAAPLEPPANSFPSGHATIGMSLALGLIVVVAHRWRWLASIAAALVAALFGTAVLTSGWHRPSDTVAAFLISLAWYCGLMAVLVAWRGRGDPERRRGDVIEERASPAVTALAGLLLVGALSVGLVLSLRAEGLHTVRYSLRYVVVSGLIDLAGVAVVAVFHLLVRNLSPDPPASSRADASASAQALGSGGAAATIAA